MIEVDGPAHFTSSRLAALELYPGDAAVGFDVAEHEELCRSCARRATCCRAACRPRASASAACSASAPTTTRCCDLATPAMGHPPVVRIAALDGDGAAAYLRHRDSLLALSAS